MAVGKDTYFDNDGKSVDVTLTSTVEEGQIAVVQNLLGITHAAGDSGDTISLEQDLRAYQFSVPSTLAVLKGAIVYVDITDTTGHDVDSTAYSLSSGANKIRLFVALENQDVNNVVIGRLVAGLRLS